jgi:hypothetical protein
VGGWRAWFGRRIEMATVPKAIEDDICAIRVYVGRLRMLNHVGASNPLLDCIETSVNRIMESVKVLVGEMEVMD